MLLPYSILAMWALLGVSALLVGATWLTGNRVAVAYLSVLSGACLWLAFSCVGVWGWILRDGLGPNSIPTEGVAALERFWGDLWPALVIAAVGSLLIWVSWRARVHFLVKRAAP
jgi:hypothetical protein